MKQVKVLLAAGIGIVINIIGALVLTLRKYRRTWGIIPDSCRRY